MRLLIVAAVASVFDAAVFYGWTSGLWRPSIVWPPLSGAIHFAIAVALTAMVILRGLRAWDLLPSLFLLALSFAVTFVAFAFLIMDTAGNEWFLRQVSLRTWASFTVLCALAIGLAWKPTPSHEKAQ